MTDRTPTEAEEAVIDAMIEHGPDGHVDGYEEITRAALADQLRADRDRARRWAVHLEQENAHLESRVKYLYDALDDANTATVDAEGHLADMRTERDRALAEAHAAHSVIEQAGLLQEFFAKEALPIPPHALERILNGETFDEVRRG